MTRPVVFAALLAAPFAALAVPGVASDSDTVDDATITLQVRSQAIRGDSKSWCRLDVVVDDNDVSWSNGDTIELWVYENDVVGDEEIWHLGPTAVSGFDGQGRFVRTYDCSANFEEDGFGGSLELYAEAEVVKDDCGTFCLYDRPETGEVDSLEVDDDGREENDAIGSPTGLAAGRTNDFIARDADFLAVTVSAVSRLQLDVLHDPSVGRLHATLTTAAGAAVTATSTDGADRTTVAAELVPIGTYVWRVEASGSDYNFYDADVTRTDVVTECAPGATESNDCGNCGASTRTCSDVGVWSAFGACEDEGVCVEGTVETESCGAGLEHDRTCLPTCEWSAFGACEPGPCEPGQTLACYSGESGTEGRGECVGGERTCVNGTFTACTGEVVPATEVCGDELDSDCDGRTDRSDPDCDSGLARLGEECSRDADCEPPWDCLGDPDPAQFVDGYCGSDDDCTGAANECTVDGVCADLGDSDYCLAACGEGLGCRLGYTCAPLPEGDACVPRCASDDDCAHPDFPSCNTGNGRCEAAPDDTDTDSGDSDDGATLRSCGCATDSLASGWWLGLAAPMLLRAARRRA